MLNQAVSAHLRITAAALITFIDPENANERGKREAGLLKGETLS